MRTRKMINEAAATLGRKGGQSRSARKLRAIRANLKKANAAKARRRTGR